MSYEMFVWLGGIIVPPTTTIFTCKLCRQILFDETILTDHAPQVQIYVSKHFLELKLKLKET